VIEFFVDAKTMPPIRRELEAIERELAGRFLFMTAPIGKGPKDTATRLIRRIRA
jgi:hypothetical protein